jgi:hypothetical protein
MPWLEARLTGARSESTEEKERILSEIVGYEDPGPGGYFEDCGNVERESRRILGEDYFLEDIDPSVRLTKRRMSYGRSEWDSDVVYRFAGLCPGKHYRLSVTYLANRRMRGSQLSLANGRTLHEDMPLPEGHPATYEYGIPMELIDDGELELCFRRGQVGRGPLVSEIWLCPM